MNNFSTIFPKCSKSQIKNVVGPTGVGYEFGLYCEDDWVYSLNEML
jgi:hypothetical protein